MQWFVMQRQKRSEANCTAQKRIAPQWTSSNPKQLIENQSSAYHTNKHMPRNNTRTLTVETTSNPGWGVVPKSKMPIVIREIERIETREGIITAESVLTAATPASSPLHEFFEWNNTVAAKNYRLWQARNLIRSVSVVYEQDGNQRYNRGFVNLNVTTGETTQRGYIGMARAMNDAELREQLLAKARQEATDWRNRYRNLTELASVFAAIDNM
jgi:hypothetical protein